MTVNFIGLAADSTTGTEPEPYDQDVQRAVDWCDCPSNCDDRRQFPARDLVFEISSIRPLRFTVLLLQVL